MYIYIYIYICVCMYKYIYIYIYMCCPPAAAADQELKGRSRFRLYALRSVVQLYSCWTAH